MNRNKRTRTLLLSLTLAAGLFAAPAYAQINFNISLAPPAPHAEVVPDIAPGYVWAPGYWGWSGERHVWVRGRPILQRTGYRWEPDRWEHGDKGYYRTVGHWEQNPGKGHTKWKKDKKPKGWEHDNRGDRGRSNNGKHGGGKQRGD